MSRNASRRGSMLENVETQPVFCHGTIHDGEACCEVYKLSQFNVKEHFTTGKQVGKRRN
jgi:hypothetical protein